MTELYLRLLDRIMTPVLIVLSLFLLMRGHNLPGGGFIAGLVIAAAFELQILSRGHEMVSERIGPYLQPMTGIGLVLAVLAAFAGLLGGNFFTGLWYTIDIGPIHYELNSPLFFDIGVFMVVFSVVTSYLLSLSWSE